MSIKCIVPPSWKPPGMYVNIPYFWCNPQKPNPKPDNSDNESKANKTTTD